MLTRTSPAQLVRQAQELLNERTMPPPPDPFPMGFRNGGPGDPLPGEPVPPEDYLRWCAGGPLPESVEGLDWMVTSFELDARV
jgi:hypothetical protein